MPDLLRGELVAPKLVFSLNEEMDAPAEIEAESSDEEEDAEPLSSVPEETKAVEDDLTRTETLFASIRARKQAQEKRKEAFGIAMKGGGGFRADLALAAGEISYDALRRIENREAMKKKRADEAKLAQKAAKGARPRRIPAAALTKEYEVSPPTLSAAPESDADANEQQPAEPGLHEEPGPFSWLLGAFRGGGDDGGKRGGRQRRSGADLVQMMANDFEIAQATHRLNEAVDAALEAAKAAGVKSSSIYKMLEEHLSRHIEGAEEAAAIRVQALFRGRVGKRKARQEAIQDAQALPSTLKKLTSHAYGTAVCKHPVEIEKVNFAFGGEELIPITITGPPSIFELVVQILWARPIMSRARRRRWRR